MNERERERENILIYLCICMGVMSFRAIPWPHRPCLAQPIDGPSQGNIRFCRLNVILHQSTPQLGLWLGYAWHLKKNNTCKLIHNKCSKNQPDGALARLWHMRLPLAGGGGGGDEPARLVDWAPNWLSEASL